MTDLIPRAAVEAHLQARMNDLLDKALASGNPSLKRAYNVAATQVSLAAVDLAAIPPAQEGEGHDWVIDLMKEITEETTAYRWCYYTDMIREMKKAMDARATLNKGE